MLIRSQPSAPNSSRSEIKSEDWLSSNCQTSDVSPASRFIALPHLLTSTTWYCHFSIFRLHGFRSFAPLCVSTAAAVPETVLSAFVDWSSSGGFCWQECPSGLGGLSAP